MLLPWRRKVMRRLEELLPSERLEALENNLDAIIDHITHTEKQMNDKLDAMDKKVDDVVAYAASVVDSVVTAMGYLRALAAKLQQKLDETPDAELALLKDDIARATDHVDEKMKELEDKLHEIGASGGTV